MPPLVSLNSEGTASHERRGHATGAARTGKRANRQPSGASPPQQAVSRMISPAPRLGPEPSRMESSQVAPFPPQPRQGALTSPAASKLGPPPTLAPPPLERSNVLDGKASPPLVDTAPPPPELRSSTSPAQPRTSFEALSSTGTHSRAETRVEPLMLSTVAPATDGACTGPGARLFVLISTSYDGY